MAQVDPFGPLRDWRSSLYRGEPAVVDQFLDRIDTTLPSGWVRDSVYERTRPHPDLIRCYLFDRVGAASVRLWLQRVTPTRVRGGPVQLLRHPPSGDAGLTGRLVDDFANGCVLPAARTAGIRWTRPTFGPRSALTPSTEMLFTQLADIADGKWPLEGRTQQKWDELVAGCLAEQVAIDRAELGRWLAESGWPQEVIAQIADQFFTDSERLAKRLAVSAP